MRVIALVAVSFLMTGCYSKNQMMVDPLSGNVENCSVFGFGWLGAPVAMYEQEQCEKKLKAAGLVTADEYQRSGGKVAAAPKEAGVLVITSEPEAAMVYAGPDKDNIKKMVGSTPYRMVNPNGRLWGAECYRLSKDGYFDSEISCHDSVYGDRKIEMKLVAKPTGKEEQPLDIGSQGRVARDGKY